MPLAILLSCTFGIDCMSSQCFAGQLGPLYVLTIISQSRHAIQDGAYERQSSEGCIAQRVKHQAADRLQQLVRATQACRVMKLRLDKVMKLELGDMTPETALDSAAPVRESPPLGRTK